MNTNPDADKFLQAQPMPQDDDPDDRPPSPTAPAAKLPVRRAITEAIGQLALDGSTAANAGQFLGSVSSAALGAGAPTASVAIIGAGPAGMAALRAIAEAYGAQQQQPLKVYLYADCAPGHEGEGAAFRAVPGGDDLLVNMLSPSIVYLDQTLTLHRELINMFGEYAFEFPPRFKLGSVLNKIGQEVLAFAAAQGVVVEIIRTRVLDLIPDGGALIVQSRLPSEARVVVDSAIVTVGNEVSGHYRHLAGHAGYIADPWSDEDGLSTIHPDATVAIAGTSLTAEDAAILLDARGHRGRVFMFSRKAILPGIRPLHLPATLKILTPERLPEILQAQTQGAPLDLKGLASLVRMEIEAQGLDVRDLLARHDALHNLSPKAWLASETRHVGRRNDMFGLQKALDDVIPLLWRALSMSAKQTFLRDHLSAFAALQWPSAGPNGVRILGLLERGSIEVVRAGKADCEDGAFVVDADDGTRLKADVFIDATGLGGKLEDFKDPMVRALAERGLAVRHPLLGARIEFETGRLIDENGTPTSPIWVGACALTRGEIFLTNELGEATRSARRSGRAVMAYLAEKRAGRDSEAGA